MTQDHSSEAVDYEERIRSSFAKQGLMATLGATLVSALLEEKLIVLLTATLMTVEGRAGISD